MILAQNTALEKAGIKYCKVQGYPQSLHICMLLFPSFVSSTEYVWLETEEPNAFFSCSMFLKMFLRKIFNPALL